jgi:hypothetical protein
MTHKPTAKPRAGLLFSYDWDALAFAQSTARWDFDHAGFDLFSFPSNARLVGFDLQRFANRQAKRGRSRSWQAVVSHHEQFGALAAALVAEQLRLPGPSVESVLAAQHKLYARQVLQQVAPECNVAFDELPCAYGQDIPQGLGYPLFVKPVKAAFSVLAREVKNAAELQAHTRFGWRELWVIRRLVEPFERICQQRLPQAGTAHRLLIEAPVPLHTPQFNLDGWVHAGRAHALGVVDAVMVPGTQAFMRWEFPSRLATPVQQRALDVAQRFLSAIGFDQGCFNMEFFHDPASDRLTIIEFNPRLASQFSDLYQRVLGLDSHALSLALARGDDPLQGMPEPTVKPNASKSSGAAASLVYRAFPGDALPRMPSAAQVQAFERAFPDALLFQYPRDAGALARDFKWLGSWRYGIMHLGGDNPMHLRERCLQASALLGWAAPYADQLGHDPAAATHPNWQASPLPTPPFSGAP